MSGIILKMAILQTALERVPNTLTKLRSAPSGPTIDGTIFSATNHPVPPQLSDRPMLCWLRGFSDCTRDARNVGRISEA